MVPQQKVLRRDAIAWVKARFHGKGKGIGQSIDGMTVNHPNRVNRTFGANEPADIFYRIGSGRTQNFDSTSPEILHISQ